jgi:hypothetical protein
MFRNFLTASTVACVLSLGIPTGGVALAGPGQNPVSSVGKATKDVGKATAKGTKEAVKTTGEVTKDAGQTVKGAVTDKVSAKCNDKTVQTGKTRAEACTGHGGVKK